MMVQVQKFIQSLNTNELQIYLAIFGGLITLSAAYLAVRAAFKQLSKQFEHKIIYAAWKDLCQSLSGFSEALVNFDSLVQNLNYFVDSQENQLVNRGNKRQYIFEQWLAYTASYQDLQKAYIHFLRTCETYETILMPLSKMQEEFQEEYRKRTEDKYLDFTDKIFPGMAGKQEDQYTKEEIKKDIHKFWLSLTEISAFLDDFRRELHNSTIGKVLNKTLPKRKTNVGKVLTKKGFKK